MRISDYNRVRVFTHPLSKTPYGFSVGHLDDFLAGVIARHWGWSFYRLPQTDEEYVRIRWGEIPSYVLHIACDFPFPVREGENNVVVFDHHDEGGGKCSAHRFLEWLVEQGAYPCVPALMDEISAWDVKGPQAVPPAHRPDPDMLTAILSLETAQDETDLVEWSPEDAYAILWALHTARTIREFVELVFETNSIGWRAKLQLETIQRFKEETLNRLIAEAEVQVSPTGVKYAVLRTAPAGMTAETFARLGADILIHPNERTPGALSVVRDSSGRFGQTPISDLIEVAEEQVVFRHPGGFMLVTRPPVTVK
jgi:hypothetical protein